MFVGVVVHKELERIYYIRKGHESGRLWTHSEHDVHRFQTADEALHYARRASANEYHHLAVEIDDGG